MSRARSLQETEIELLSSFDQTLGLRSDVDNIDLFTDEYFQDVLADASNKDFQKIKGAGISLFVDYELSTMGPIDNIKRKPLRSDNYSQIQKFIQFFRSTNISTKTPVSGNARHYP